jgi:hypothetical protein
MAALIEYLWQPYINKEQQKNPTTSSHIPVENTSANRCLASIEDSNKKKYVNGK